MAVLEIATPTRTYPIVITHNAVPFAFDFAPLVSKQVLIVSNNTVAELYLSALQVQLQALDCQVAVCLLPDGEVYKTQESVNQIYDALLAQRFGRDCTLLALGGGVIGDMTGFAAASFMRGVRFIQLPTTLLAQVDSSVGGKTGINHALGKNMIGAFWQPTAVLTDVAVLHTLPKREFAAGMAEVIKYGCISDDGFLTWLDTHAPQIINQDREILAELIYRACQYKARIVALDETEQGVRAYLNFGHTFAHAIETYMGYGNWLHGEAVAAGMVLAARLSMQRGQLTLTAYNTLVALLQRFDLPTKPPAIAPEEFIRLMGYDKKTQAGKLRFVLLNGLGNAYLADDVSDTALHTLLTTE